jgi:amino acid permease
MIMKENKRELNKVLNTSDVLVTAFGAMIGWGWVVSSGGWIEASGALGTALGFIIGVSVKPCAHR